MVLWLNMKKLDSVFTFWCSILRVDRILWDLYFFNHDGVGAIFAQFLAKFILSLSHSLSFSLPINCIVCRWDFKLLKCIQIFIHKAAITVIAEFYISYIEACFLDLLLQPIVVRGNFVYLRNI